MTPVPEPPGDIRAQLAAALNPHHPKRAAFLVPRDAELLDVQAMREAGIYVTERSEGTLVSLDLELTELFTSAGTGDQFDVAMAEILDLPEDKISAERHCRGNMPIVARMVQARDSEDHVVQEAVASPLGLLATCDALLSHVPEGGALLILPPIYAISRRVAMRWVER